MQVNNSVEKLPHGRGGNNSSTTTLIGWWRNYSAREGAQWRNMVEKWWRAVEELQ